MTMESVTNMTKDITNTSADNTSVTLTAEERARLDTLTDFIVSGLDAANDENVTIGGYLQEVQTKRLYRDTDSTLEAYMRRACGISRSKGHRLINYYSHTWQIRLLDEKFPIVAKLATPTESSLRPLTCLDESQRAAVLDHLLRNLKPRKDRRVVITVTAVKRAIAEVITPIVEPEPVPQVVPLKKPLPPSDGLQFARLAVMRLEEIGDDDSELEKALDHMQRWIDQRRQRRAA
jgi:hypothetical protein